MYNVFAAGRKSKQIQQIQKIASKNLKYVKRYYNITRPSLIDNHNKRINSFIRRMEQQPIQVNLDPNLKYNSTIADQNSPLKNQKRSYSNNTGRRDLSSSMENSLHQQTFKFKDNQDWRSLYTPLQRIQRQRNYHLFKQKYGDPTIAYRSIGSQSQYKPGHEFRGRQKSLQINPPMRYTNKPTKQVLAKLKSKYSKKKNSRENNLQSQANLSQSKEDQMLLRRNTGSSLSGINDDNLLSQNTEKTEKDDQEVKDPDFQNDKKKPLKMHFKQIMDLEQNVSDIKTRKALRQILYKCGVYRRKNKRVVTDSQVDQLSEFTEGRDH